ncbi:HlyD family type I secretion periplasmic adaptor subunit [Shumkonia mesophila]|uniref:HlyD family type I secretion periplasmic adaptor subunit n=1 Tax=Shumkonia mesophila TaxID=2838854 RepID=UPI002934D49A|nr:HlyD family type I secretion periplasmic adaptor subunit [Shumkonia mesophila]
MKSTLALAAPALRHTLLGPVLGGTAVCLAFFGGLSAWSALVPLASAAIGPGIVSPDGSRRTVQHLEGGIVERLLVADGSRVAAGDPLVVLADKAARATYDLTVTQHRQYLAMEARLVAERDGEGALRLPPELADHAAEPEVIALLEAQRKLMVDRRASLLGRQDLLRQRIAEIEEEIAGLRAQAVSRDRQLSIIEEEIATVAYLVGKGLTPKPRLLALQREQAELLGQQATTRAAIARSHQSIGESTQRIVQLDVEWQEDVSTRLNEVVGKLTETKERLLAASDVLRRLVVKAPVPGTVVQMRLHTVGGVIGSGDPILDIVPSDEDLVIDARIAPTDIDVVRKGQVVQVVLSAFAQRTLPRIEGRVRDVSADRIVDPQTQATYFKVRVEVDRASLAAIVPGIELSPGMPAEVMVMTGQRTAFEYLSRPFLDSLRRSLTES